MGAAVPPPAAASPGFARLHAAAREARDDAAPFTLVAATILIALALSSKHAGWESLGRSLWWMWLVVAAPYVLLAATLFLGLNRLVRHDYRREIVIGLLTVVWVFNVLGVVVLVASLIAHSASRITGAQLLASRVPRQEEYIARVPAIAILPWFLAGALFPITATPVGLTWVARFLPLTHGLAVMRYGLLGDSSGLHNVWRMSSAPEMAALSMGVVGLFAVLLTVVSVRVFTRAALR